MQALKVIDGGCTVLRLAIDGDADYLQSCRFFHLSLSIFEWQCMVLLRAVRAGDLEGATMQLCISISRIHPCVFDLIVW